MRPAPPAPEPPAEGPPGSRADADGPRPAGSVPPEEALDDGDPEGPVPRARVLGRLLVALVGMLVGVGAVDAAVGAYDARRDLRSEGLLVPDPLCGWVNRPGFENEKTRISSLGVRSPEIPPDADPMELRIVGAGASNVYGAGEGNPPMDRAWSAYLERGLERELGGPWRVLNAGVMGYSMVQSARRATQLLDTADPDLVLLFVSPGPQSLLDPSATRHWVRVDGELVPQDIADAWPRPLVPAAAAVHRLLLRSNLYVRYRNQVQDHGRRDPEIDKFMLSDRPVEHPEIRAMLQRTVDELAALREETARRGVALRAVVVPHYSQFAEPRWRAFLARNQGRAAPPLGTPRDEPSRAMARLCEELDIETWSLYPAMQDFAAGPVAYTLDGSHWSEAGHRRVAEALLAHLARERGLVEALRAARARAPRS